MRTLILRGKKELRRPAPKSAAQNQQEELGCVLLLGYKYFYNLFGNVGNKS